MEFNKLLIERRSVRKFDASKTVTEDQIREMIDAARFAPSWKNDQPARYYAVCSPEKLAEIAEGGITPNNIHKIPGTVMLVQTFVKGTSGFNNGVADNRCGDLWGAYDLGLSTAYLILKAKDLGLDTLIMGMRNGDFLREALQIPENEELMAVIAVGYKDEEPALRPRKPADEIVKFF